MTAFQRAFPPQPTTLYILREALGLPPATPCPKNQSAVLLQVLLADHIQGISWPQAGAWESTGGEYRRMSHGPRGPQAAAQIAYAQRNVELEPPVAGTGPSIVHVPEKTETRGTSVWGIHAHTQEWGVEVVCRRENGIG